MLPELVNRKLLPGDSRKTQYAIGWQVNPAKIQGPAILVKFVWI